MKKFNMHTHLNRGHAILNGFLEDFIETNNFVSLGIHPWFISTNWSKVLLHFRNRIKKDQKVVAIGECGLDKLCITSWELQIEVFKAQIELAEEFEMPLIIHSVKAYNECELLLKAVKVPVVFHGFNKKSNILNHLLRNDHFYFSFGKAAFRKSSKETILNCPLERLFLETDNDEIAIESVYQKVALIKGVSLQRLENQILLNRTKVFGI